MSKEHINITLDIEVLEKVDSSNIGFSRSAWINYLLKGIFKGESNICK